MTAIDGNTIIETNKVAPLNKMIELDYNEEIADLISQQAEEVYKTGHFNRVNIVAQGRDGYTYQAIHEDEELDSPHASVPVYK